MFIDTHCHFDFPPFIDEPLLSLQLAAKADVSAIIVPTVSADRFATVLALSQHYSPIYAALGLHPIYSHQEQDLSLLEEQLKAQHNSVVAVGEIGLDQYVSEPALDEQLGYFRHQLQLAKQFELPVLLHSRKSHDLLYKELRQANLPCRGIIHGFAGSLEQAKQFVSLGYYIGVGGTITYERANKTRKAIAQLPLSCLVLETDAPDMPIFGYQGEPNRPERIVDIFKALCQLRTEAPQLIEQVLLHNTLTLFNQRITLA